MAGEGDTMQDHMDITGWSLGLSCIEQVKKVKIIHLCVEGNAVHSH
jgi:hypothetical protein